MTLKDRMLTFINSKGLTTHNFERLCGLSNAAVSKMGNNTRRSTLDKISNIFPDLNINWLLTGEGAMLRDTPVEREISLISTPLPSVPLYSLESVAGFSGQQDQTQYVEKEIPWADAKDGDFAVHVTGNSMEPKIPHGAMVLVRPYAFADYTDLEFGRVHIVVTDDGRAMIKVVKLDPEHPHHILLISFNSDYPTRSIPVASIRRVFLAVAVQAPL